MLSKRSQLMKPLQLVHTNQSSLIWHWREESIARSNASYNILTCYMELVWMSDPLRLITDRAHALTIGSIKGFPTLVKTI